MNNKMSTICAQPNSTDSNDLTNCRCRTRKAIDTVRKHGILYPELERRRKPYDCHGRNTTYTRRSSQNAQMYKCYSQALYTQRDIRSHQGWRPLSSKIRGSRQLHNQKRYQERRQINKASLYSWQTTIKKSTAVRLLLRFERPSRSSPWNTLPTFSIHRVLPYGKVLCMTWAYERRCAHYV